MNRKANISKIVSIQKLNFSKIIIKNNWKWWKWFYFLDTKVKLKLLILMINSSSQWWTLNFLFQKSLGPLSIDERIEEKPEKGMKNKLLKQKFSTDFHYFPFLLLFFVLFEEGHFVFGSVFFSFCFAFVFHFLIINFLLNLFFIFLITYHYY